MWLYAHTGQIGAALRQFETCKRQLREELGVMPEEQTLRLLAAIRARQLPPLRPEYLTELRVS
jgi:DNA-binding SARP family transcriptional activator